MVRFHGLTLCLEPSERTQFLLIESEDQKHTLVDLSVLRAI